VQFSIKEQTGISQCTNILFLAPSVEKKALPQAPIPIAYSNCIFLASYPELIKDGG